MNYSLVKVINEYEWPINVHTLESFLFFSSKLMRKKHNNWKEEEEKKQSVDHSKRKFASEGDIYILIYDIYDDVVHQIVSRFDNSNDNDDESLVSFIFDKHRRTCVCLDDHYCYYYHHDVQSFDRSLAFVPLSFIFCFVFFSFLFYTTRDYQLHFVCR